MPRWPIALLASAVLFLLEACPAGAQVRVRRNLTVDDGLAQSQVLALFEDRDGYLWAGTNDGVSRFDGSRFTSFQSSDGLPPGPVRAVRQSADGALFFATDRGVSIYRDGRFTSPPADSGLSAGEVASLAQAPDGTLWFVRPGGVSARRPDGRYERLAVRGLPANPWLMAALPARDGTLFLGGEAGAFAVRSGEARLLSGNAGNAGDAGDIVHAIHQARDGTVRFGTGQGLAVLRNGALEPVPGIAGPVVHIAEGSDGTLYLSTHQGVLLLRGSGLDRITTANGLGWDEVHAVAETRDGAVYIATERGIGIYDRGLIESWTPDTGLPDGVVWSIAEDGRGETRLGEVWLGTDRGLAHRRDGRWEILLPDEIVRAVVAGRDGRIYAGTQQSGLRVIESGRTRTLPGLPDPFVRALWEDPGGALWIGTNRGLAVLRDGRIRTLQGLPHLLVTSFAGGPDGSVWIGTYGGLVLWKDRAVRVWTERDGLADDAVWSVLPGQDGSLYVGTAHGVSVLRDGRFRTIDAQGPGPSLSNDTVYCLLQDGAGRVYASTNRGVNVLDAGAEAVVEVLERADGLASIEGNLGACHRDARGRLWFGNVSGVSVYDPARELGRREPPRVRIAGVRLYDKDLPLAGLAERPFGYRDNYFQFAFAGIDHAAPHRVRYRYRLAGLDRGWTETDRGSVQYTNLDPGRYRFEVQAASGTGPWSAPAGLPFAIQSPIWRRWWFVLLAALALGSAVASVLALRVRQLLALERLRTAIAADLHDHIGAGLTEIAILSEIVAHRTGGPAGAPPEMGKVADTARLLLDKMNEIVWLVNPRRDSLHDLFVRLKDSYSELFSHAGVLFRATNLSLFERVRLPMSYRENLYLIFKEALNNSLRHSGCQEIELSVALQGRRLEVVLRDDGRGFDAVDGRKGNGLGNMQSRAERIGGRLSIEAGQGAGTAIRFVGALP